jgi:hypothetical protein
MFLAVLSLLYPLLRIADVFPTATLVEASRLVSDDRATSLQFRFDQEQKLLERASERPLFGWGRYGRNRVYAEDWEGIGGDVSVTDGRWIITFGQFGLFGFLAEFGLLALPILYAVFALNISKVRDDSFIAALALIVSVNIVDLLPNSSLSPWTWLVAGALLGRSERLLASSRNHRNQPELARSTSNIDRPARIGTTIISSKHAGTTRYRNVFAPTKSYWKKAGYYLMGKSF